MAKTTSKPAATASKAASTSKGSEPTLTATPKNAGKGSKGKAKDTGTKLTSKQQAVIDYLASQDATTNTKAVNREKVWTKCGVGVGVIATLKALGLMERIDHEDGTKQYKLTAEGKKLAGQGTKATK